MTQPMQPSPGYYPPLPQPAPQAPGYPPQAPGGYYPPAQAAPPAPGYPPQGGYGYPPQGAPPAPGYQAYGAPAPGFEQPQAPAQPAAARGSIDDFMNQADGGGGENITKVFVDQHGRPKPYGSVTVSFIVSRRILNTDIRQQTNAQRQLQFGFDGTPLYVMVVPCRVTGATDGSHAALFPNGEAAWWVKGQTKTALVAAMAAAGVHEGVPEEGARIDLTLTGERASKQPGHNPSKQYAVTYARPATAAGQPQPAVDASAFQAAPQPPAPQQPPQPQYQAPAAVPQPQYAPQQPAPQYAQAAPAPVLAVAPAPQYQQAPQYAQGGQLPAEAPQPQYQQAPQQQAQPQYAQQFPPGADPYAAASQPPAPQQYQQAPPQYAPAGLNEEQARLMAELRANGGIPAPPVAV